MYVRERERERAVFFALQYRRTICWIQNSQRIDCNTHGSIRQTFNSQTRKLWVAKISSIIVENLNSVNRIEHDKKSIALLDQRDWISQIKNMRCVPIMYVVNETLSLGRGNQVSESQCHLHNTITKLQRLRCFLDHVLDNNSILNLTTHSVISTFRVLLLIFMTLINFR